MSIKQKDKVGSYIDIANGHPAVNVYIKILWHQLKISHIWCEDKLIWTDENYKYFGTNAETKTYMRLKDAYEYMEIIITAQMTNRRIEILKSLKDELERLTEERKKKEKGI